MKRNKIYNFIVILAAVILAFTSCTEDTADMRYEADLRTAQYSNVTSSSATVVGFVVAQGTEGFSEKGVCYATTAGPTVSNSKVAASGTSSAAAFTVNLTGLSFATKYYVRAYATINGSGTIYGEEYSFTTLPVLPTVTTADITTIKGTSAVGGGNVTNTGGATVTARGVVFGINPSPTVSGSKTTDGTGSGAFVSNLTGLKGLTKYYVRAYATNSVGTAYGPEVSFTTLVSLRTWYIPGNYVAASYPGTTLADWSPANSPQVKSVEATPDNLEGYVYMANASNSWKFATQPNWDGPNYGGSIGTLDASGGDYSLPAGYYKINADAGKMTFTAVATSWGVIGSASPKGWDDETALTFDPASQTWQGGMHLTAAEIKFRANHSWDYNYGSSAKNATLNAGGDNIPVAVEADYAITLDLSHPNAYTYAANRWGLIGSATPGGWSDDTNMTWDATNKVFTVTLNLTAGDIKFRANDGWDVNYGGPLDALVGGGDNIPVAASGNYTVTFDPWKLKATVTKN